MKNKLILFLFGILFLGINFSNYAQNDQDTTIYKYAEEVAEPIIGTAQFIKEIGKNLIMPKSGDNMCIHSNVYIQFVIEKDGSISNIEVLRLDTCQEFKKAVLNSTKKILQSEKGKWKPAKNNGNPVRLRYILPIHFRFS